MKRVAIIPARGGSKRLPRKNILPVNNHPIIYYPLKAAIESKLFDEIIVSTEDTEISDIVQEYGAKVFIRSKDLASDEATVVQVCLDVLDKLKLKKQLPEVFCCLYATALFVTSKNIVESYRLFQLDETDVVMGVSEYSMHPILALKEENGYLKKMWPEYANLKRHEYPKLVVSNGTLYWTRTDKFLDYKTYYVKKLKGYYMSRSKSVDLDTPDDYLIAKTLFDEIK